MKKPGFEQFNTLTFDVVGTLIDFETGMLDWFRPRVTRNGLAQSDEDILLAFARSEYRLQKSDPDMPFTAMLPPICVDVFKGWDLDCSDAEAMDFQQSIKNWPAFSDAVASLEKLAARFRLVAVTNADTWALSHMGKTLGNPFAESITCDEVGVNKPSPRVFAYMLEKLAPLGIGKNDILHTAQSQYHDIVPATRLGFATAWIERRQGKSGFGATPEPGQILAPTFHARSMADFVSQIFTQSV